MVLLTRAASPVLFPPKGVYLVGNVLATLLDISMMEAMNHVVPATIHATHVPVLHYQNAQHVTIQQIDRLLMQIINVSANLTTSTMEFKLVLPVMFSV